MWSRDVLSAAKGGNPTRPTAIYEQTDSFRSALFTSLEIQAAKIFAE
jgi:hypothetical protein